MFDALVNDKFFVFLFTKLFVIVTGYKALSVIKQKEKAESGKIDFRESRERNSKRETKKDGKRRRKVRKERITKHKRKKVMDTTISTLEER